MDDRSAKSRLWTPWRLAYISGANRETGCVFCNRLHRQDDRSSLILHRGRDCFVIMNLFPYSTGHLLIVSNDHVPGPEEAPRDCLREMAELLPTCLSIARRVLNCQGFNVGINLGEMAGAGVTDHFHEHIVPRWVGDANFMPILASTAVMPELMPATYAKLRAEFGRDGHDAVRLVVVDESGRRALFERDGRNARLPRALLQATTPVWRGAIDELRTRNVVASIADWAGPPSASSDGPLALLLRADNVAAPDGLDWVNLADAGGLALDPIDAEVLELVGVPALIRD
jgi:ATP adenylyltransferase